jgi:hypothetical protein
MPDDVLSPQLPALALALILAVIAGLIAVDRRTPRPVPVPARTAPHRERHIGQHRAP